MSSPRNIFLLIGILAGLLVVGCSPCRDEIISNDWSPDKMLVVTVFYRDCGATTKEITWVTIHRTNDPHDMTKDIAFTAERAQEIQVLWMDDANVLVRCRTCRRPDIHTELKSLGRVSIKYEFDSESQN